MELPIFNTYINFSHHQMCCFTLVPLFVLDESMAWNRCLQHTCFKKMCKIAQASKKSDSNAQHFISDLLTRSWFHSMFFALLGYQFPYIVMNRCLYLTFKWRPPVCMFDKFYLTFNFESKVPRDVFKMNVNCHLHFLLKCHLNVTCLVVRVISITKVSIDVWFFPSRITLHVKS
jgi:hypothetical protein